MESMKLNKRIFIVLWIVTGLLVCFLIALWTGHIGAYFPSMSEDKKMESETGTFICFLCVVFLLGFITMLTRYFIIYKWNSEHSKKIDILNKIAFLVGLFSLFGMTIIGCYSILMEVHMAGAYLLLYSGILYGFLQVLISLLMPSSVYRFGIFQTRIVICIFSTALLIGMISAIGKGMARFGSELPGSQEFALLLTSTICKWMMVICFLCFFFSFPIDFRKFTISISIFENEYHEKNLETSGISII